MNSIVSSSAGRIRIRDKGLRSAEKLHELEQALSQINAISQMRADARTGSLLLYFDPRAIEHSAMEAHIQAAVGNLIGKPATPESLLTKKNINRYNKLAMLASLGSSLAFTAVHRRRWRRWHALTGYVFVANLGVHLYIYRKSLLRLFR